MERWAIATLSCGLDAPGEVTLGVLVLGPVEEVRTRLVGEHWIGAVLALVRVPGEASARWVNVERLSDPPGPTV